MMNARKERVNVGKLQADTDVNVQAMPEHMIG
jgi:hypothetical protein